MAAIAYHIKIIGLYGSQYSPNNRVGIELPPPLASSYVSMAATLRLTIGWMWLPVL